MNVDIEDVWDAIVDLTLDRISVDPFVVSNGPSAGSREEMRRQLESQMRASLDGGDVSQNVTPTQIPFDICYWTDFGADGSKVCVDSATPSTGWPDCDTMSLPYLHYMSFAITSFDMKWDRSWSTSWSANVWVGSDPQDGCVYTGMEAVDGTALNQCAKVICPDDFLDAGAAVATAAEAAFETAWAAVEEWANQQGLWDWIFYVVIALIAIALIIAVATGAITFSIPAAGALLLV